MKKARNTVVFMMVALLAGASLNGCGGSIMTRTARIDAPDSGYALVSFVRPSMFGGAIRFGIWDGDEFIGVLTAKSLIQYKARPGRHLFIARAENWSYVDANLEAGKHYVIVGKVFPGVWKARVGMDPADTPEETRADINKYVNRLTPMKAPEEARDAYAAPRLEHVRRAIEKFEAGEVKYATLSADSGV